MRPKHQKQMQLQPGTHATAIRTQIPLYRPFATGYEAEASIEDAAPARHAHELSGHRYRSNSTAQCPMRLWSLVPGAYATDHEAEASAADDADAAPARPGATAIRTQIPLSQRAATGYEAEASVADADAAPARRAATASAQLMPSRALETMPPAYPAPSPQG